MKLFKPLVKQVPISSFMGILLLYLFISLIVFVATSGGWSSFVMLFADGLFALMIATTSLSTTWVWTHKLQIKTVAINKALLCLTLIIQLFAVLFNHGDNADTPGSYLFIDKLLHPTSFLSNDLPNSLLYFSIGLLLTYFVVLAIFVFWTFAQAKQTLSEETKTTLRSRKNLLGMVVGGAMSILLAVLFFIHNQTSFLGGHGLSVSTSIPGVVILLTLLVIPSIIIGSLLGIVLRFPTIPKTMAFLLMLISWPLMGFIGTASVGWYMQTQFNKVPVYPNAIQTEDSVRIFDSYAYEYDFHMDPVVTGYYETDASVDTIKTFFDRNLVKGYTSIPYSAPLFGWGTTDGEDPYGMLQKLAQEKKPVKSYISGKRQVFVHVITDPQDVPQDVAMKFKPGKQYYKIQMYFR